MQLSDITVKCKDGLHARDAAIFIQQANKFKSNILITKGNATVNAKSIMGVMALSVAQGDNIKLRAEGSDETEAVKVLSRLLAAEE